MKKIVIVLAAMLAMSSCTKEDETCVICFIDGQEAANLCADDFTGYETAKELEASIRPLIGQDANCEYY